MAVHLEETELRGGVRLQIGTKQAILKYKMSEEEYVFKLVKALERLGLKRTGGNDVSEPGTFKMDAADTAGAGNTGSMTDHPQISGNHKTMIAIAAAVLFCVIIGLAFGLSGKSANTETTANTGTTVNTDATATAESPGTYAAETQPDQNSVSSQTTEAEQTLPQSTESTRAAESQPQSKVRRRSKEIRIFQKDDLNYEYYIEEDHVVIKGILRKGSAAAETFVYPEEIEDLPVTAIRHDEADVSDLYYTDMKEVILPETLNEIGDDSFRYCSLMKEINIPESVVRIGEYAFAACKSLEKIILPESVQSIGKGAFQWCKVLKQITLPEQITEIPGGVFRNCTSLESVILPDKAVSIGAMAFSDCENLTRITFPSALARINFSAFSNCKKLSEITLPATVSDIEFSAFDYCDNLRTVRYQGTEESFLKINTHGRDIDIYEDVVPHADVSFEQ